MNSKVMSFLAAGLVLTAFTWVSPAPVEAQSCNNGNRFNNARSFKRFKRAKKRQWRRAFNNRNRNNSFFNRNRVPVNVNPYFSPVNGYYGANNNPYFNNGGFFNTLRNIF